MSRNEEILTIGQMVAIDYRNAQVFKKYGIDFCCGGNKTLKGECERKGLNYGNIISEMKQNATTFNQQLPYNEWELDFLIDFIINIHHSFIRRTLPDIISFSVKVLKVHGNNHSELYEINLLTNKLSIELYEHMKKEETILFPYIKEMIKSGKQDKLQSISRIEDIRKPIDVMEFEHEQAGSILHRIRQLCNNYLPPVDACTTYKILYQMLESFEKDLHQHIHLENNILFPKALRLREALMQSTE
jgi:regulator of cell morphogenesis and NO signaling